MKGFSALSEKPWLAMPEGHVPVDMSGVTPTAQIALRFLLMVISIAFVLIFVTFLTRSQYPDFTALAGEPWLPFNQSPRLWATTAVLVAASAAMHWSLRSVRAGRPEGVMLGISIGGFLALVFIMAQWTTWNYLTNLGYGVGDNPANSYFFLFTGLHALHLLGGVFAVIRVFIRIGRGSSLDDVAVAVKACTTYWHYLLGLWVLLFFLLTRTPETYALIAAACGLG
jgi:cytochrome c oxidase subunit 3